MIRLSDYLDYLNSEIIQARKKADENAVLIAKEYSKHEYLKYFKAPRYSIPSIKLDIPVKITDIDQDSKYNFKFDEKIFLADANQKIKIANAEKQLNIPEITEKQIQSPAFRNLIKTLEKKDHKFINNLVDEVKTIDFKRIIPAFSIPIFRPSNTTEDEKIVLNNILASTLVSRYQLVSSKLNNLYIDPNTNSVEDKDKIFVNLHVEMEEEGIRIVKMQDSKGDTIEEIMFE